MKYITAIFLINLLTAQAFAADIYDAKIEVLMLDRAHGAKVFIKLNKTYGAAINCHTSGSWQFVLDVSDEFGKTLYSSLLANYSAGKSINFKGSASCSLYPNIETLRRIELI